MPRDMTHTQLEWRPIIPIHRITCRRITFNTHTYTIVHTNRFCTLWSMPLRGWDNTNTPR